MPHLAWRQEILVRARVDTYQPQALMLPGTVETPSVVRLQVDTMIVQAIGLLDDLDKELNTYAMRVREWYGWHFPEMTRLVADNIKYAATVGRESSV